MLERLDQPRRHGLQWFLVGIEEDGTHQTVGRPLQAEKAPRRLWHVADPDLPPSCVGADGLPEDALDCHAVRRLGETADHRDLVHGDTFGKMVRPEGRAGSYHPCQFDRGLSHRRPRRRGVTLLPRRPKQSSAGPPRRMLPSFSPSKAVTKMRSQSHGEPSKAFLTVARRPAPVKGLSSSSEPSTATPCPATASAV